MKFLGECAEREYICADSPLGRVHEQDTRGKTPAASKRHELGLVFADTSAAQPSLVLCYQ